MTPSLSLSLPPNLSVCLSLSFSASLLVILLCVRSSLVPSALKFFVSLDQVSERFCVPVQFAISILSKQFEPGVSKVVAAADADTDDVETAETCFNVFEG